MTDPHIITLEDPPSLGSKIRVYVEAQPVAELLERLDQARGMVPSTDEEAAFMKAARVDLQALLAALQKHESRPS